MRFRVVTGVLVLTWFTAGSAMAQDTGSGFVRGIGGVSFAADPAAIYGGGAGFKIGRTFCVTGEFGRVQSVAPQEFNDLLDLAEQEIELELGAPVTLDANIPALYFTGGVRADVPTMGRVKPFIEAAAGVARLSANVDAEIGGLDVSDEVNDLLKGEHTSKFMLALGGGITMQVSGACWLDVAYRYHRIATEDPVSNTNVVYAALRFAFR